MPQPAPIVVPSPPRRGVWALSIWLAGAALLALLDNTLDLANLALILVLVSALAALWSTPWAAVTASALGVLAFNYGLVPPRGSFTVDLHQHALLLATMLVVSGLVALLMARQRRLAAQEHRHAQDSEALRLLSERLREADEPAALATTFRQALQQATAASATLLLQAAGSAAVVEGEADDDEARRPAPAACAKRGHGAGHRPPRGAGRLVPAAARPRRQPRCRGAASGPTAPPRTRTARPCTGLVRPDGPGAAARAGRREAAARTRAGAGRRACATRCSRRSRTTTARRWPPSWARRRRCDEQG